MGRTRIGLSAMMFSMILSEVISLGSLVSTGGRLSPESIASPFSIATILVSLLEPVALILEIIAMVLIASDSRRSINASIHRRLIFTAGAFFVAWAVLNFIVYLPLYLLVMKTGSLQLVRLALAVKAAAALFQYSIPFLLLFGIARSSKTRLALWAALIATIVGGLGVVAMPIASVRLEPIAVSDNGFYVPKYEIDYTSWPYSVFLTLSHSGGILYLLIYALTITKLRSVDDSNASIR